MQGEFNLTVRADDLDFPKTQDARPEAVVVAALKRLGGIGHLSDIAAQCAVDRRPLPLPSIRRLVQEFSTDALWNKTQKPPDAPDLFYSLDGLAKRTRFWGLRGFAVGAPLTYPVRGLHRPYSVLLDRADTPLGNVRGIAYCNEAVHAIQVDFSPNAPYPDTLLPNGQIEHIGEGLGEVQRETGGNRGMLDALQSGDYIPVFQSIGPKGNKRYADLGPYRVSDSQRRLLQFTGLDHSTDAFVFTLQAASDAIINNPFVTSSAEPIYTTTVERGGYEPPIVRPIADRPPQPSDIPARIADPEARRVAMERRSLAHHDLVKLFEQRVHRAGLTCNCDQYADVLCDGNIFEMKSLQKDDVAQIRAAVGQLYHYMFIHRTLEGFEAPKLYAVFDRGINEDLQAFLVSHVNIGVIWVSNRRFAADSRTCRELPWLTDT